MVRKFIFIFFVFILNLAIAEDLQGKITYTEETARLEAFKDLPRKISKSLFKDDLKDKHYKENYINLKNKNFRIETEPKRTLTPFYVMNQLALYGVQYDYDDNKTYYYNVMGHFAKIEISDYSGTFPYRTIAYNKKGEVINITLAVSEIEEFIFNKKEELLGHWLDNDFLNNKGKKKIRREFNY